MVGHVLKVRKFYWIWNVYVEFDTFRNFLFTSEHLQRNVFIKRVHGVVSGFVDSQSFKGKRLGLELSVEGLIACRRSWIDSQRYLKQ